MYNPVRLAWNGVGDIRGQVGVYNFRQGLNQDVRVSLSIWTRCHDLHAVHGRMHGRMHGLATLCDLALGTWLCERA